MPRTYDRAVLDAALALLTAGLPDNAVGDSDKPAAGGWDRSHADPAATFTSYVVVAGDETAPDGSLEDDLDDVHVIQTMSVALDAVGADQLRYAARTILRDRAAWAIPGRAVMRTELDVAQRVRRDDDPDPGPSVFYAVDQVRIFTTPA